MSRPLRRSHWLAGLVPIALAAGGGCGSVELAHDDDSPAVADAGGPDAPGPGIDAPTAADAGSCPPGFAGDGSSCVDVVSVLHERRVRVPCIRDDTKDRLCISMPESAWTGTAGGAPGARYTVHLRVRGIVELHLYTDGQHVGEYFYVDGAIEPDPPNVYRLHVGTGAVYHDYYFNYKFMGEAGSGRTWGLDYRADIEVRTGDGLLFEGLDSDAVTLKNRDGAGNPIRVPDVPPWPDPFDGQFVQLDVIGVDEVPGP